MLERLRLCFGVSLAFLLIWAIAPLSHAQTLIPRTTERPSFDCGKARAPIELLICADAELAQWDGRLGQAYNKKAQQFAVDDRKALLQEQRQWAAFRRTECAIPSSMTSVEEGVELKPCILRLTKERIEALGGGLNHSNGSKGLPPTAVAQAPAPIRLAQAAPATTAAQAGSGYEVALRTLAGKLVSQLEAAGQKSGTVLDFTDLQGAGTELGRFLAQELSDQLVSAAKTFSLVDRANLQHLLRENKLSMEGLVNPESSRKLGNMIGIDTVIFGTVTPIGQSVRLSIRAVAVETGKIVASQSTTLPAIGGLGDLYTRGVASSSPAGAPDKGSMKASSPDVRGRFRSDSIKVVGKFVKYTKVGDGTESCGHRGVVCATASFVIENLSGVGFNAAIKAGSTSIGSCVGHETEAAGLKLYDTSPGWSDNVRLESAQRFIPPNAKIPVTIKLEKCSSSGMKTVDVAVAVSISVDGQAFEIPLSASNVPVH